MKKIFRKGLRVLGWSVAVFMFLWMLVWAYVLANKKKLIGQVATEINSKIKGEIQIGDLEPSFISTFPSISIKLSDIYVRDTLWAQHHHDLIKAEKIYVRLQFWSLFSGSPEITKVIIDNASIYLFSEENGYSNEYLFNIKSKDSTGGKSGEPGKVPDIELNTLRLTIDQKDRGKFYDFDVKHLNCKTRNRDSIIRFDLRTELLVHSLTFNKDNGSFVKEKPIEGKFRLFFNKPQKKLSFDDVELDVDDHTYTFSGFFDFMGKPPLYYLDISSDDINYASTSVLLSQNISSKLTRFEVKKTFDVRAIIDGRILPNRIPLVNVQAVLKNNTVKTSFAVFEKVSAKAVFNNQLSKSDGKVDGNSGFIFTGVSGKVENISCTSNRIEIFNLTHPVINCDVHAGFNLTTLNDLIGISSIAFTDGACKADVRYKGALLEADTAGASIFGSVHFERAGFTYTPRNLSLNNCSGDLVFNNKDVFVKELKAQIGNSQLVMNGAAKNLTSLIDKSPEKTLLTWNIASPKLNLNDFITFLNKRSTTTAPRKTMTKKKYVKLARSIDRMLEDCTVALQLNADELIYKKFEASNVAANIQLTDRLIALKNFKVQHAGGSVVMDGKMQEQTNNNLITFRSTMNNVDIKHVFNEFNNFGQDGVIDKNLKGKLSAEINVTGLINGKAEVVENSLKGIVDVSVKNGELNDFEPLKNISRFAFKNRDFTNIRFAELKEKLEVDGSQFKVNRMEIQSTVMTMFVEGIYDIKKGTDLSIQVPLSNLAKRGEDFDLRNKGTESKAGASIFLRAKTAENGKAKISWDPFKMALKKNQGLIHEMEPDTTTNIITPAKVEKRRKLKDYFKRRK